ncbi:MAG TPA: gamma carbonic anhydrase family protein [Bdellovibrionales bacterium]|jgi:carbonic anhydrase/acetyltransferase-like protein (isoleucine patch superfamily)|nr:gamma carbonic anhydrase family protein [Bdellovibrionales bacterium]
MSQPSILSVRGKTPEIGEGTFLADGARIIGDVTIGKNSSIWYNVVIRGDVGPIAIGDETNIQDGSVIHGTFNKAFAKIGKRVTVGHAVVLHGCSIGDECLIGMGTIIMDNAKIGSRNIVGAGSLVTENFECLEEGWLILGRPAKAVRKLKPEESAFLSKSADNYLLYKTWYEEENAKGSR